MLRRFRCTECEEPFYALTFTPRCQNCTPIESEPEEEPEEKPIQNEEPKKPQPKRRPRRATE